MSSRLENIANVTLAIAAVVVTVTIIQNHRVGPRPETTAELGQPVYIDEWRDILRDGLTLGDTAAPVQIIEFADLECPFCAQWHREVFSKVRGEYPNGLNLTLIHLPLASHRFARQAATAVECAAVQGRLAGMLDLVYEKQDSIGLLSWSTYARRSMVPDSAEFAGCLAEEPHPRIAIGEQWARELGVGGTPTFILNGWRLIGNPGVKQLEQMIENVLGGTPPVEIATSR